MLCFSRLKSSKISCFRLCACCNSDSRFAALSHCFLSVLESCLFFSKRASLSLENSFYILAMTLLLFDAKLESIICSSSSEEGEEEEDFRLDTVLASSDDTSNEQSIHFTSFAMFLLINFFTRASSSSFLEICFLSDSI
jgi:hypothetical protein